jgi:hypothetical protein
MISATQRSVAGALEVASWAIVTDPKDEAARKFYEAFGFFALTENRMFLPLKSADAWLNTKAP